MAVSLIIPSLCSCGDDDEDSPLYINDINMEGIWVMVKEGIEEDYKYVYHEELYKFTKDGVLVIYESLDWPGYLLVKGVMQCAFSDFYKDEEGTWSVNGNSILVRVYSYSFRFDIIKVISRDEVRVYDTDEHENIILRRVKGFKK
jgi:hypothetical protein